ncbi:type IV toxin-antitoxin system AbiEi family antitoxin domain-containing protein [Rhodococcus chondri]|uniref:Type IV toxin-antitoxin system AbiEi family antitoxin domain-containing protein n=1 Tax=Rhodococcus chondri TaxID=3065941 RepID=A0ABU7JWA0_9NOCA|nr:type IV toxin-antitoxin system AbiEi family antitoxin domain-containing protein [Rhodococcus sp. CC-R104]MEE2034301.1 type IV toxin-antitoxin system AbiEi family antitoxin domain-containing protein [Rhodococcus sp. CC-R104]
MGAIIRRSEAQERGVTAAEIRRLIRTGAWKRLAPGLYIPSTTYEAADDRGRHRFRAAAAFARAAPDAVLSHVSAAVVHGLEAWRMSLDDVHLTRRRSGGSAKTSGRVLHASRFDDDEVVEKDGMRVLAVARTLVDLGATVPFEQAVVVGDHALRNGLVTLEDLETPVERMGRHPGRAKAARAVRFMSDRSDSVGESRSRVLMVREQLPLPQTQVDVFDEFGNWLARVDFLWQEHGVIGEFDGRIKYRRDGVATTDAEDVVFREKLREDRLRHAGWVVVRWTWADLERPGVVAERIRRGFALAARGTVPTGSCRMRKIPR